MIFSQIISNKLLVASGYVLPYVNKRVGLVSLLLPFAKNVRKRIALIFGPDSFGQLEIGVSPANRASETRTIKSYGPSNFRE